MARRGPNPDLGVAILRVVVGVVYITHGIPKLLAGAAGTTHFLAGLGFPLPGFFAWVVTLLESLGGLALIVGFLVTPVAVLFAFEMLMGIILVHARAGWYVLGPGRAGSEFDTVLIAALLALVLVGPGTASVDGRRAATPVSVASSGPGEG